MHYNEIPCNTIKYNASEVYPLYCNKSFPNNNLYPIVAASWPDNLFSLICFQ